MTSVPTRAYLVPWVICCLGAVFFGYGYCLRVAPSAMIDELMRDFAVTAAAIGNLAAVYFYVYAGLQLPIGVAADNIPPRRILVTAVLVVALGALLFANANSLALAYLGRILIGAGSAAAWVCTLKLAAISLPSERFVTMAGITNVIGLSGAAIGQAPLALAVASVGWREATLWMAIAGFVLAGTIWLIGWLPSVPDRQVKRTPRPGVWPLLRQVLANRDSWAMALAAGAAAGPMLSYAVLWAVPYGIEVYRIDRATAGLLASSMLLGWGFGGPIMGWLSERQGRRRPAMLAAPIGGLAIWPVLLWLPGLPVALAFPLHFLLGVCIGGVIVGFTAAREFTRPVATATMTSLINATIMTLTAVFQGAIGYMLDLHWTGRMAAGVRLYDADAYRLAFSAIPVTLIAALVLLFYVPETYCRQRTT